MFAMRWKIIKRIERKLKEENEFIAFMLKDLKQALEMYCTENTRLNWKAAFPLPELPWSPDYTSDSEEAPEDTREYTYNIIDFGKSAIKGSIKAEESQQKDWYKNIYGEWVKGEHDSDGKENGRIIRLSFGGIYIERYTNGDRNGSGIEID